jgi:hypothetical protein
MKKVKTVGVSDGDLAIAGSQTKKTNRIKTAKTNQNGDILPRSCNGNGVNNWYQK